MRFSPDRNQLLSAGGKQAIGGKRWVEVWRAAPDRVGSFLVVATWLLAGTPLVLAVIVPLVRRLARSRGLAANDSAESPPRESAAEPAAAPSSPSNEQPQSSAHADG